MQEELPSPKGNVVLNRRYFCTLLAWRVLFTERPYAVSGSLDPTKGHEFFVLLLVSAGPLAAFCTVQTNAPILSPLFYPLNSTTNMEGPEFFSVLHFFTSRPLIFFSRLWNHGANTSLIAVATFS
jgi:hypothetical protein